MTSAPDDLPTLQAHLGRAMKRIFAMGPEYARRYSYYDGTRAEVSASPAIRKLIQQNAEASPLFLAHIPVDALCDKVELSSLTAKESDAADALTEFWDANDLDDEVDDWVRKACAYGDYYVIVDPSEEDTSGAATAMSAVGASPVSTVMVYSKSDGRTPLYGARVWVEEETTVGKTWAAMLYYDDATVSLETETPLSDNPKPEDFVLDDGGDDGGERVAHLGGEPLLVHFAVDGKPYGVPVHMKAFGPQDAITKISAINLNNVDGQGFAARWALADPTAEIDDDIDDDFGNAGPNTKIGDFSQDGMITPTTGSTRVRTIPGAIALLQGVKQVGQFNATGSDDFLKNLDWYTRAMAVATGTPLFEFDMQGDQPSGEARRRAEGRINNHARKVQRTIGSSLKTLGDVVLGVMGKTGTVEATWKPTDNATDTEGIALIASKISTGVPIGQAFLEAGYTQEQVDEWFPDGEPNINFATVTTLASALAALGNAKTLGVITDSELRDLLPTILTGAKNESDYLLEVGPKFGPGGGGTGQGGAVTVPGEKPPGGIPPVLAPGGVVTNPGTASIVTSTPQVPPAPPKGFTPAALAPFAAKTAALAKK